MTSEEEKTHKSTASNADDRLFFLENNRIRWGVATFVFWFNAVFFRLCSSQNSDMSGVYQTKV